LTPKAEWFNPGGSVKDRPAWWMIQDGECQRLCQAEAERYYRPDQYNNPANWRAHFETTGHEIWRQAEGR
jgi:cysteine synthase